MEITKIVEKVKISDLANSGCYCFRNGAELGKYIGQIIERGEKQLSQDMKGEFYTSGVIAAMLRDGIKFKAIMVATTDFTVLGVPDSVTKFCRAQIEAKQHRRYRICFDLDHTLVTAPDVPGDYATCRPIKSRIDYCNALAAQGHTIVISTARRMRTHSGNVGAILSDVGETTLRQLREFKINFSEISFGKPWAEHYIGQANVCATDELAKETGIYCPQPQPTTKQTSITPEAKTEGESGDVEARQAMNLIIPLGGIGSRFQKEGYFRPKPFVRVLGKPMIEWLVDNLRAEPQVPQKCCI
jgi:capsule biosynthesis phosphatase